MSGYTLGTRLRVYIRKDQSAIEKVCQVAD